MNTHTKIEIFAAKATATDCCSTQTNPASCQCDDCDFTLYKADDEAGLKRAEELDISEFPAVAINNQIISCSVVSKALEQVLESQCCCNC